MKLFSQRELKLYLLIVGITTLIAVTIALIVVLVQRQPSGNEQLLSAERMRAEGEVDTTEIMIPNNFREIWKEKWYPYRETLESWSWEQVEPYWTPPEELLLEYLEEKNRNAMRKIFNSAD